MTEELQIRGSNARAHADIEVDLIKKKNGQVTFTLRINAGNIVDYALVEYIDVATKYDRYTKANAATIQKLTVSPRS